MDFEIEGAIKMKLFVEVEPPWWSAEFLDAGKAPRTSRSQCGPPGRPSQEQQEHLIKAEGLSERSKGRRKHKFSKGIKIQFSNEMHSERPPGSSAAAREYAIRPGLGKIATFNSNNK
jgi:hypothetical protein